MPAPMIAVRIMGWHDGRQAMDFTVNAAAGYPLMTGPEEWDPEMAREMQNALFEVGNIQDEIYQAVEG